MALGQLVSTGPLWSERVIYPLDYSGSTALWNWDLEYFERFIGPLLARPEVAPDFEFHLGRLGMSLEGGGKRRIFAIFSIGNYINQRLLRPYHDLFMWVLDSIPNDGTFNQEGPLRFLRGCTECFKMI